MQGKEKDENDAAAEVCSILPHILFSSAPCMVIQNTHCSNDVTRH